MNLIKMICKRQRIYHFSVLRIHRDRVGNSVFGRDGGIVFSDIDRYTLENMIATLSYHLQVAGGSYEEVPIGIFEVSEANRKAKCLEIKTYDYMVRFLPGLFSCSFSDSKE